MGTVPTYFTRHHVLILGLLWLAFTSLTLLALRSGLDHGDSDRAFRIALAVAATPLGPMTGSISRGNQSCCLACSQSLLSFSGPALLVAIALQFIPLRPSRCATAFRLGSWTFGLLIWFGSGILSLGHALS